MMRTWLGIVLILLTAGPLHAAEPSHGKGLSAGAAAVDIAPERYPVIVNGYWNERLASRVTDGLWCRALVLDDGRLRLAIAVVDTCVLPRELVATARRLASQATGIPAGQILISATHTHSAPSVLAALGSRCDEEYARFLPGRIAEAIARAARGLEPAEIGSSVIQAPEHTHCRLWILAPGKVPANPLGRPVERILMCPPYAGPDNLGPAGPVDAALTLLAVRSRRGRPIAVLANYGMHFYGAPPLSSDWTGQFCQQLAQKIAPQGERPVVIMSQGTAGDQHWMDFSRPARKGSYVEYGQTMARVALPAYQNVRYQSDATLACASRQLTLGVRMPSPERLAWARTLLAGLGAKPPQTKIELTAREQVLLAEMPPTREVNLQAMRIGPLGLTAIPCEVYGLTGLRLKAQSPLVPTMNIELAGGEEGYLPPPEQHRLGGYSTWEARTSCLEVGAEPKVVEAMLALLEEVSGRPRRNPAFQPGPYARSVLASRPLAYWPLAETAGRAALDASGAARHGRYEGPVAFYLEGPPAPGLAPPGEVSRCPQFARGRMVAAGLGLGEAYTIEFWLWNSLADDFRTTTAALLAIARSDGKEDRLLIGGRGGSPGRLLLEMAGRPGVVGRTRLAPRTWHHVTLVGDRSRMSVYLNGNEQADLSADVPSAHPTPKGTVTFAGCADEETGLEGKLDEVAVYARTLPAAEIAAHFRAAAAPTPPPSDPARSP